MPEARPPIGRGTFLLLCLLFLLSGAAALVYEVSWTRRLLLVVGSTSAAAATVLAGFLGGLGLGGFLGGRLADRSSRPLALYGALEIGAAAWALLVPLLLDVLDGPFHAAAAGSAPGVRAALRVAFGVAVVLPGATLLGATFPALLRHAGRDADTGSRAALLYGSNTLGAVGGALWAGWSGIFTLGVSGSARAAAAVAATVGALCLVWGLGRGAGAPAPPEARRARVPTSALLAAAACGFVGLGLEAAGVRILVFFVEGFTASFAAMLAAFLLGLALGSLVLGPALTRRFDPARALLALLAASGAVALLLALALPGLGRVLEGVRGWAYGGGREPATGQRLAALAGSLLLFFGPGLCLGATFPLAIRWAQAEGASVGRAAGRVYLWNSVGAALSPLLLLGLLPFGGPLLAWCAIGVLALAAGVGGVAARLLPRRVPLALAGLALAAGGATFGLLAARDRASPAALVEAGRVLEAGASGRARLLIEALADETTTASAVAVAGGERLLYTDEFQAAATGASYRYMRMLGHLPALLAGSQENVLNVAFGTGTTAGALAAHRGVKRLEVVEVSRAVLALAPHFRAVNRGVLDDPRVVVRVEDGRHALALHAADLDVVTLEPLLPYVPAALPFYTEDFYRLARSRLREGGVLCQWVPVHAMPLDLYASLLWTFFEVFPDGTLWFFEQSTVLVGRRGGEVPSLETVRARAAEVVKELAEAGFQTPAVLGDAFVATGGQVREAIREAPPGPLAMRLVTDEHPFPEAHPMPRAGLVTPYERDTLLFLSRLAAAADPAHPELAFVPPEQMPFLRRAAKSGLAARASEADSQFRLAQASSSGAGARLVQESVLLLEEAVRGYEEAAAATHQGDLALVRRSVRARRRLLGIHVRSRLDDARRMVSIGDEEGARRRAEDALLLARRAYESYGAEPLATERPAAAVLLGEALVRLGRCREAERVLSEAGARWPWEPRLKPLLAAVHNRRLGRDDLTRKDPEAAAFLPDFAPCRDDAVGPAAPSLDRLARAMVLGREGEMRVQADLLLALGRSRSVPASDLVAAVEGSGEPSTPETEALRAWLLRSLRPDHPALPAMLRSADAARREAAVVEASRGGFVALGVEAEGTELARAPDAATRKALAQSLAVDGTRWSDERLLDLLGDAEADVRRAAFASLSARLPEDGAGFDYDATAPAEARAAAIARLREWLASRPPR